MATITDPGEYGKGLENEIDRFGRADIEGTEREVIQSWFDFRRSGIDEDLTEATLQNDLCYLRLTAARTEKPLPEWTIDNMTDYAKWLKEDKEYAAKTRSGYHRVLRLLFRYMDQNAEYGEYPFWESISLPQPDETDQKIDRTERLTEGEIADMKAAARSARDAALVEFLAGTGVRISLAMSLRVGDIDLEAADGRGTYSPNPEAVGLKGHPNRDYPFYRGRAEIRNWLLGGHPDGTNPDAPLWPKLRGYDPDESDNVPSTNNMRKRLHGMAETVGENTARKLEGQPAHGFRHFLASQLADREDYSPSDIQVRIPWSDKVLIRMINRYDDRADEERLAKLDRMEGRETETTETEMGELETARTAPERCPHCGYELDAHADYCSQCGRAVQEADIEAQADSTEEAVETAIQIIAENPDKAQEALEQLPD